MCSTRRNACGAPTPLGMTRSSQSRGLASSSSCRDHAGGAGPSNLSRISHDLGATGAQDKSGADGGSVSVSTPHGSQGTQAYKGDDVVSGGLPQTRRATFRVSGRPGRLTVAGAPLSNRLKMAGGAPRWHPYVCMLYPAMYVCAPVIHALRGRPSTRSEGGGR